MSNALRLDSASQHRSASIRALLLAAIVAAPHAATADAQLAIDIAQAPQADAASPVPAPPAEPGRQWSLSRHSDFIALLDCEDCGDDIGLLLECQARGKPALASLYWAAVDSDQRIAGPVVFEVSGQVFSRMAETMYFGQFGQVPQLELGPGDPLLAALRRGTAVKVTFGDIITTIGLQGFAAALEGFDRACHWHPHQAQSDDGERNLAINDAAPKPKSGPQVLPRDDGAQWYVTPPADRDSPDRLTRLTFGIPETDAVALQATCEEDRPEQSVTLVAVVDIGDRAEAETIDLLVESGAINLRISGEVSRGRETYPGVRSQVGLGHPIWWTLQRGDEVYLRAAGGPSIALPPSESKAIAAFLATCSGNRAP
ncbi:hypothetical protein G3480_00690 [Thiorhodococcus mannitoliphagus]|uniref:Uncharacterized protein n=1 Tax=Thiorhodococcus mannitoliphagus TaxID=329406 RepID=A0A6P1DMT3_9GAMM|nr:hypothetical protein [Thiorhodococcus mannitoliphagus]NEX18850.1 hypothetical protein [Thiorhodococcus mannitoliphagus]